MPYIARLRINPGYSMRVATFSTMGGAQDWINSHADAFDASIDFVKDGFN
ncbi:MAG: hypothetical protein ISN29_01505 [Gammaproteobacteria bacterium AqS3]|nr:hypothetical protein [Gammaproteobacteria bacterium AqS3]